MHLWEKHPYSLLFAGAGIVLLAIVLSAKNLTSVPSSFSSATYVSTGNSLSGTQGYGTVPDQPTSAPNTYNQTPGPNLLQTYSVGPTPVGVSIPTQLPAAPETPSPTPPQSRADFPDTVALLQQAYSLPDTHLFLIATSSSLTPAQQALHYYGNEAGLAVLTFENAHADMAQVLKAWIDVRKKGVASAGAVSIADDLTRAGRALEQITDVPPAAANTNAALAASFQEAGDKLKAIYAVGADDNAFLEAINSYNAAADSFSAQYLALANIFTLNSISFSASEPGSAFQFPGGGI